MGTVAVTDCPTRQAGALAMEVVAGLVAAVALGHVGRGPARPSPTHQFRWHRSRQFATRLRRKRRRGQICGIAFSVMLGMIAKGPLKNCTTSLRRLA